MKKFLCIVGLLFVFQFASIIDQTLLQKNNETVTAKTNVLINNMAVYHYVSPQNALAIAWQVAPPDKPIEERSGTRWLWWIFGVIFFVGIGIVIYFVIKRDPRKDAR